MRYWGTHNGDLTCNLCPSLKYAILCFLRSRNISMHEYMYVCMNECMYVCTVCIEIN